MYVACSQDKGSSDALLNCRRGLECPWIFEIGSESEYSWLDDKCRGNGRQASWIGNDSIRPAQVAVRQIDHNRISAYCRLINLNLLRR